MQKLKALVGEEILILIPYIHKNKMQKVKLHGVEIGGLWVETQRMTAAFLAIAGLKASPKTPIFFLPYAQIGFVVQALDVPSFGEKALGL